MKKKDYMSPATKFFHLKYQQHLMAGSIDANGMNTELQTDADDEVEESW